MAAKVTQTTNELYVLQASESSRQETLRRWNSCPVAVGNCVYKARSLYALLSPGMQYYDDLLCSASLPANKNGSNPYADEENILSGGGNQPQNLMKDALVTLYPNPISQGAILTIEYNLPSKDIAQLKIYDAVGKLVQQTDLNPTNNKVSMPLIGTIANGIYKVVIIQNEHIVKTIKLNVVQ